MTNCLTSLAQQVRQAVDAYTYMPEFLSAQDSTCEFAKGKLSDFFISCEKISLTGAHTAQQKSTMAQNRLQKSIGNYFFAMTPYFFSKALSS